ncbi:MAG TPA: protein kinase [Gemmatimonadales bacterium]|jgi:serine/threonine-protein kinase|nr:protein kinase [Gemmatimonadales bacterium]
MAEVRLALVDALGPVYRVEREVRPVGECRLFIARRIPDGPELLVKVLPRALSLAIDARVFEREVLLLAKRLRHDGLVPPRGAGRAGPVVYHTRPFIEGTTLRAWLHSHRTVPLARAVEILRDVLAALAEVHAAQLVHGDVRPENVLLTDRQAVLADAGIADAVRRSLTAGPLPPPAASTPQDDLFAVGSLVHEMLTGRPPLAEAEPLEETRSLPAWLPDLLRRCQAAKPSARWSDAGEALAAMRAPPPRDSGDQLQL